MSPGDQAERFALLSHCHIKRGSQLCRIGWGERAILIDNVRWERTWAHRGVYRHGYPGIHPYVDANRVERHEPIRRSAVERAAARGGHAFHEEHHRR
jgi:hypothetical protein